MPFLWIHIYHQEIPVLLAYIPYMDPSWEYEESLDPCNAKSLWIDKWRSHGPCSTVWPRKKDIFFLVNPNKYTAIPMSQWFICGFFIPINPWKTTIFSYHQDIFVELSVMVKSSRAVFCHWRWLLVTGGGYTTPSFIAWNHDSYLKVKNQWFL